MARTVRTTMARVETATVGPEEVGEEAKMEEGAAGGKEEREGEEEGEREGREKKDMGVNWKRAKMELYKYCVTCLDFNKLKEEEVSAQNCKEQKV